MLEYIDSLFGVPSKVSYRFRLSGKRYQVRPEGLTTLKLLAKILAHCRRSPNQNWAIRIRPLVQEIERLDATPTLCLVALRASDPTIRNLAIWLRGRCGGHIGSSTIATFASDPNFSTRKEVARALKRMAAWPALKSMSQNDPAERIRKLATCDPSRPITQRVANFKKHVSPGRSHPPQKRSLFTRPDVDLSERTPPRSIIAIRLILRRIARLVGRQT